MSVPEKVSRMSMSVQDSISTDYCIKTWNQKVGDLQHITQEACRYMPGYINTYAEPPTV